MLETMSKKIKVSAIAGLCLAGLAIAAGAQTVSTQSSQMITADEAKFENLEESEAAIDKGTAIASINVAKDSYLYTHLKASTNSKGCGYSDWNCMTNSCKTTFQNQSVWRGNAGCWKNKNGTYICYWDCIVSKKTF